MTGGSIAVDTSVAIGILNGEQGACGVVAGFREICLPVAVIGELRFGALNSRHAEDNVKRIEKLISSCKVLIAMEGTAAAYADLRIKLKKAGTPIPENDLWIAATCVERGIPLATDDSHFDAVKALAVVPV